MKIKPVLVLFGILTLLLLGGCNFSARGVPTVDPAVVLTSVAETVLAEMALTLPASDTPIPTASSTLTATPTPLSTATFTASPTTNLPANQGTGGQTNTCDSAVFVSDVSIPDGTVIAPGTTFTKKWRIQNAGSCTWTPDYGLKFLNGDQMGGVSPQIFGHLTTLGNVLPGEQMDVTIELTAPTTPGTYTGYWQLQNATGVVFQQPFYVQIQVSGGATPTGPTPTPTFTPTGPTVTPTLTPTGPTATTGVKANLEISGISFDPLPTANDKYTIRITVENTGSGDAGSFSVQFWADSTNSGSSVVISNVTVAANSSKTVSYDISCSTDSQACYPQSGEYSYKVLVDSTSTVTESDENNNTWSGSITVGK